MLALLVVHCDVLAIVSPNRVLASRGAAGGSGCYAHPLPTRGFPLVLGLSFLVAAAIGVIRSLANAAVVELSLFASLTFRDLSEQRKAHNFLSLDGIAFFNILQSLGVPSRFLNFPDENHWVTKRDNSLVWHKYIFNWIRFWTGQDEELIQSVEGIDVTKS